MPSIRLERGTTINFITTGASPGNAALNAGIRAISAEYDNSANLFPFLDLELLATWASSPTGGSQALIFIIPCNDGTNYTDGDASIAPGQNLLAAWFNARATTSAQRLTARGPSGQRIEIPPCKFKIVIQNDTGTNISAGWQVNGFPYGLKTV